MTTGEDTENNFSPLAKFAIHWLEIRWMSVESNDSSCDAPLDDTLRFEGFYFKASSPHQDRLHGVLNLYESW